MGWTAISCLLQSDLKSKLYLIHLCFRLLIDKAGQNSQKWVVFSALSIGRSITESRDGLGIVCFWDHFVANSWSQFSPHPCAPFRGPLLWVKPASSKYLNSDCIWMTSDSLHGHPLFLWTLWTDFLEFLNPTIPWCCVGVRSIGFWVFFRIVKHTRCGPYFGTTVKAMQCLTYQTEGNVRTCKKETKDTLFWGVWVCGCVGERISLLCRQVTSKVPKTVKNLFVLQFCSWDGSFRHGEMKRSLCLYFQHVTRYIGTDFVEESRRKMQRSEEEHFFREGCSDRKEFFSNTANKRCSRQVLQLRCSWWYSIKFYT